MTTGKITKVEKVADTWLIWFNGEPAYCCSHGKNGRPTGCPTYNYAYTSTVGSDQFIPGDHYGNQLRIWGGLNQLSLGLLAERHTDAEAAAAYAARTATTYSAVDAAVLEYAYSIYDEDQLYVIENYPQSQAARLYLESAKAALGQATSHATTYDGSGYYTYIYDSGNPNWQIVAVEGPPIGEEEEPEPTPTPTYDANWNVDITESASASFEASMTVKVDKYANVTHEALSDAGITVQGSPANGDLDGGTYTVCVTNPDYTDWEEGYLYYTQDNLGKFKIEEKAAAYGYTQQFAFSKSQPMLLKALAASAQQLSDGPWSVEFEITGQDQEITYLGEQADRNQPWGNKVIIRKTDSETGNAIKADAQFSLYEWNAERGLYEISPDYAIVRDADGSYTVQCLHKEWTLAG